MKKNIFKLFLNKFLAYPIWIKQVVFYRLWQNMSENGCKDYVINCADKLFAMHIPTLTFQGKQELLDKKSGLDSNIYSFLKYSHSGYSILETSLNMFMSIEEISKLYIFCLEQTYIEAPEHDDIYVTAGFISGKFPIGDYLLKKGSVTKEQLDKALAEQEQKKQGGERKLLGKILVEQGVLPEDELKLLFKLKSDSKKRFVINPEFIPNNEETGKLQEMEKELNTLREENLALKKTMTKIINMVKSYDI